MTHQELMARVAEGCAAHRTRHGSALEPGSLDNRLSAACQQTDRAQPKLLPISHRGGDPLTIADDLPLAGVVRVLEDQGQRIMCTYLEARIRIASDDQFAHEPCQVPPPAPREPR